MMKLLGQVLRNKKVQAVLVGVGIGGVGLVSAAIVRNKVEKDLVEAGCETEVAVKNAERTAAVTYVAVMAVGFSIVCLRDITNLRIACNKAINTMNKRDVLLKATISKTKELANGQTTLFNALVWLVEDKNIDVAELATYIKAANDHLCDGQNLQTILKFNHKVLNSALQGTGV